MCSWAPGPNPLLRALPSPTSAQRRGNRSLVVSQLLRWISNIRELCCLRPPIHSMLRSDTLLVPDSFPKDLPANTPHPSSLLFILPSILPSTSQLSFHPSTLSSLPYSHSFPPSLPFFSFHVVFAEGLLSSRLCGCSNEHDTVTLPPEGSRQGSHTVPLPSFG